MFSPWLWKTSVCTLKVSWLPLWAYQQQEEECAAACAISHDATAGMKTRMTTPVGAIRLSSTLNPTYLCICAQIAVRWSTVNSEVLQYYHFYILMKLCCHIIIYTSEHSHVDQLESWWIYPQWAAVFTSSVFVSSSSFFFRKNNPRIFIDSLSGTHCLRPASSYTLNLLQSTLGHSSSLCSSFLQLHGAWLGNFSECLDW